MNHREVRITLEEVHHYTQMGMDVFFRELAKKINAGGIVFKAGTDLEAISTAEDIADALAYDGEMERDGHTLIVRQIGGGA